MICRQNAFPSNQKDRQRPEGNKRRVLSGVKLLEMSAEVRRWYEDHRKEILFQAERICSYDLIQRYMDQPEISQRLFKLVSGMVEPRRWLLLMVDEVYDRLKERHLPQ